MTLQITIANEIYDRAVEIAAEENVSIEVLLASAVEQHLFEIERLKRRAARGSLADFQRVMDKVPDVEPPAYDKLD